MVEKMTDDLERNSPYRVAYELALTIARAEGKLTPAGYSGDRKYWLELYQRCRAVVKDGSTAACALKVSD